MIVIPLSIEKNVVLCWFIITLMPPIYIINHRSCAVWMSKRTLLKMLRLFVLLCFTVLLHGSVLNVNKTIFIVPVAKLLQASLGVWQNYFVVVADIFCKTLIMLRKELYISSWR
jgi:hypothetical protein